MVDDEPILVNESRVACDGGGGALGHPRVFLEMGEAGEIVCPYCSRHYVRVSEAAASHEAGAEPAADTGS